MFKRWSRVTLLCLLCAASGAVLGQEPTKPYTKEEILRLLKPVPGQRYSQAELAGEIAQRGIAFAVTEQTLAEFQQAGARAFLLEAIKRADPNAPPPATARPTLRPRPDAAPEQATAEQPAPETAKLTPEALAKLPLLEQARYHAREFTEELPNFIVTQFVTRFVRTPEHKDWHLEDKLEVELSYHSKQGEKFKLVKVNDKPTRQSYEALQGATSTGEFGSMLGALFAEQSQAEFKEVRRETFRNRATVLYEFRVKKAFSNNQITDKGTGRTVTTAYAGSVWIEQESGRVLRIESSSEDIQRGFPITLAESAVEYDWVKINDQRYLLPIYAEVILGRDAERFYSRNVIEMRNYHMFETDVKIGPGE